MSDVELHYMLQHVMNSNEIENVKDPRALEQSLTAWDWLVTQPTITAEVVFQVHKMIMYRMLPDYMLGKWRDCWVSVGSRTCPAPTDVPDLIQIWLTHMEDWAAHDPKNLHVEYETIHPFPDGNGRTGRMFMWWHEVQLGQEPTIIYYKDRWEYYKWFPQV